MKTSHAEKIGCSPDAGRVTGDERFCTPPKTLLQFSAVLCLLLISLFTCTSMIAQVSPPNPVPLVNNPLVPDATAPGGSAFTLTVNGTGFVSGSVVNWNGGARPTTFINKSQLKAAISAADIAKFGTAWVTVVNSGPGGGTSNTAFFPVTNPVSSLSFTGSSVATGNIPDTVTMGDFNGDGKLDLAISNADDNTVSILLGNGDGTFQPHVDYPVQAGPDSVIAADFNGDGKLDVAVRNTHTNTVSVLLGNGDGTFQPTASFTVGDGGGCCVRVAAADFNGDGKLDLIATNRDSTFSILLGNGDGTFKSQIVYAMGFIPVHIGIGDFNGDGKLDLALTNNFSSSALSILLGNGDGTFQPPVQFATGDDPGWINVADLNGDGILDLVIPTDSNTVSIFLGNGDGTFRPRVDYLVPAQVSRSDVADLNGDGKLDVVIGPSRAGTNVVSVLLGNGDGTFRVPITFPAGNTAESVVAGDFNGDGRLDLAVTEILGSTVSILLQGERQRITFKGIGFERYGVAPFALTATASSGLPVTFSVVSGPATVKGNMVTITGTGVVTVEADQAGNDQYRPAPPVQRSFTVRPANLTVTAVSYSVRYGSAIPALTYNVTGFVNGDSSAVLSGAPVLSTMAKQGSPVGSYGTTITQGTLQAANYQFDFVSGTVKILPAELTVRPNAASAIYGAALPKLGYTLTGFANGDTSAVVSGAPVVTTTAKQGSPVGTYPVTATQGTLAARNYTFAFAPGHLTIRKEQLTVKADNKTVAYGAPFPPLTYKVTGFVNGDTSSVVTGVPTLGVKGAAPGSPPGQYEIGVNASNMKAANYYFHAVNGVLTIQ